MRFNLKDYKSNTPITKLDSVYDILRRSRLKKVKDVVTKQLALTSDFTRKTNNTYQLNFDDFLKVRFMKEKEEYSFRPGNARLPHQLSVISLTKKPLVIFKEGETESPIDLLF